MPQMVIVGSSGHKRIVETGPRGPAGPPGNNGQNGAPGSDGEDGADGIMGALPPGPLAERPAASAVEDGQSYGALDDRGGTHWVPSSDTWHQIAPSRNEIGGKLLAQIKPTTDSSVTCTSANTSYRIPDLTTPSFVMPTSMVMVFFGPVRLKRSTNAETVAHLSMIQTTNAWSSNTNIGITTRASSTDLLFGVVNVYDWHLPPVLVTASPGATVQVALAVQNTTAGHIMDVVIAGAGVFPHLTVVALGA